MFLKALFNTTQRKSGPPIAAEMPVILTAADGVQRAEASLCAEASVKPVESVLTGLTAEGTKAQ